MSLFSLDQHQDFTSQDPKLVKLFTTGLCWLEAVICTAISLESRHLLLQGIDAPPACFPHPEDPRVLRPEGFEIRGD